MRSFNSAFVAKWKWHLVSEKRRKWKEILISKYGIDSGQIHTQTKYQSWWWKNLSKVYGEGEKMGWFQKAIG